MLFPSSKSLDIAFYCKSVPFSRDTQLLRTSLGGSETALIQLAQELSQRGHAITIFTNLVEGAVLGRDPETGIAWHQDAQIPEQCRCRQFDVFCSLRMPQIFLKAARNGAAVPQTLDAKMRVLWNQDLLHRGEHYAPPGQQVDLHVFVSDYHQRQYIKQIPWLEPWCWTAFNPVDLKLVEQAIDGAQKNMNQVVYLSRPERGLETTLAMFQELRKWKPNLELKVCRYYSMYEPQPNIAEICRRADELVSMTEGASFVGHLDKMSLYRLIAESGLVLYAGVPDFAETAGIAALEAQACGTPMIASKIGGLVETLNSKAGRLIEGSAFTPEYQEKFVRSAAHLLSDGKSYRWAQEAGWKHVQAFDTPRLADAWEERIERFFHERFETHTRKIFENLMWHEDIATARHLAQMVAPKWEQDIETHLAENVPRPEEFARQAVPAKQEMVFEERLTLVARTLMQRGITPARILDFAAGNGTFALRMAALWPEATYVAVDYSEDLCKMMKESFAELPNAGNFQVVCGSFEDVPEPGSYDLVFCGEFLEHSETPWKTIEALEALAAPGAWMVYTTPSGPFWEYMQALSLNPKLHVRSHRFHFESRDWFEMVGSRTDFEPLYMPVQNSPRGTQMGHWLIRYRVSSQCDEQGNWIPDAPVGIPDFDRKMRHTRPRQTLSVCMITRNEEGTILRALNSINRIADELWIADTGSTDQTLSMIHQWAKNEDATHIREIGLCPFAPPELPAPRHFGWARDESVREASGDWILWIDSDEILYGAENLSTYMTECGFEGYVIRQHHKMHDMPERHDTPIRLFRNGKGYNCADQPIHEHFFAGTNRPIEPTMLCGDVDILHDGYVSESVRRFKCATRNIPILEWAMRQYPERVMNRILYARDCMNIVRWDAEANGGRPRASLNYLQTAFKLLDSEEFQNPESMWFSASFPIWQEILQAVGAGRKYPVSELDKNSGKLLVQERLFRNIEEWNRYALAKTKEIERMFYAGLDIDA